jgi:hypothetical protein
MAGWGSGGWGISPWGEGGIDSLQLLNAQPLRENVVRLEFNAAPVFTGVLDPSDASSPDRYDVTPIDSARNVNPILAEVAAVAGSAGRFIDVTVDRHFSAYPARYRISVNQLRLVTGELLDPDSSSAEFDGSLFEATPFRRDLAVPIRDIANPQTREALFDPLPQTDDPLLLGSIPVDEQGDYSFDEGITSYKKRILRRVTTEKGQFAHMPDYGVGVRSKLKRLGTATVQAEVANDAEIQISQEPETDAVSVVIVPDSIPGLFRMRIKAKAKKLSDSTIDLDVPFSPTG